jgi:branched-chain amino acid transport system permease protein
MTTLRQNNRDKPSRLVATGGSVKVAPTARKRAILWIAALLAGLVAALTFAALPASAATIDPDTATEKIQVWVRLASDKTGVPDIAVTVKGDGLDASFVTGDDGKVLVGLPGPGTYTVELDESTFPDGAGFPKTNPVDKTVQATNTELANFLLDPANSAAGATPTAAPAPTDSQKSESNSAFWRVLSSKIVTGLIFGLLIALAAIGLSLIYGTTGLNNFAHGELVTFGALMAYTFSGILGWPAPLAIIVAVILGGAFGWVQNGLLWKPLRKRGLGLIPLMIVTIGLSLALRYIFQFTWGADRLTLPNDSSPFLKIGSVSLRFTDVAGAVVAIVLLLIVAFVLLRTKIGKATRAVADNRSLASASGINVESVIRTVWIGGAALAALSGVFIGYYQSLRWDTGASILLLIFAAVTLGGLGTAFGALIGSLVIGIFINVSTIWIPENLKYVAALVVMILILLFRPQGILGRKDRIG